MANTFKNGDRARITKIVFGDDWPEEFHDEYSFLIGAEGVLTTPTEEDLEQFRAELASLGEDDDEITKALDVFAGVLKIDAGVEAGWIGFEWGVSTDEIELVEVGKQ